MAEGEGRVALWGVVIQTCSLTKHSPAEPQILYYTTKEEATRGCDGKSKNLGVLDWTPSSAILPAV